MVAIVGTGVVLLGWAMLGAVGRARSPAGPPKPDAPGNGVPGTIAPRAADKVVPPPADPGQPLRRKLVGTWLDDYQGKRTMTLHEDGTGTMTVQLSGLKASLFASKLRFDMRWSVESGRLKKRLFRV